MIFKFRRWFWKYFPITQDIQQVTGQPAKVEGMGIVPIRIPKFNMIYLLYPCYHMPEKPTEHTRSHSTKILRKDEISKNGNISIVKNSRQGWKYSKNSNNTKLSQITTHGLYINRNSTSNNQYSCLSKNFVEANDAE